MAAPVPAYPRSTLIKNVVFDKFRCHRGDGDMWPITWADDDHLYGGAGDNSGSPMNFWRIIGGPSDVFWGTGWGVRVELVHPLPVNPKIYCQRANLHPTHGVKPAGVLSLNGVLYMAVELHNYGDNPAFNRQHNLSAWIITSLDYGKTWNLEATPTDFFTHRLASPHFLQFGKDYAGARDGYIYTYFPGASDDDGGASYWENGDYILLGRVPKYSLLERRAWEFCGGVDAQGAPVWYPDDGQAEPVFSYPHMTGENHVAYNPGIKRYLMGNYSFLDEDGHPRPYHAVGGWPASALRSQLTLFEASEPWGPWSLFYQDDNWGTYGDYQPNFPTKWMSADGKTLLMVSSGSFDDYNLTLQKITLEVEA
ncbi:MAG TPA: hypothetical protein PKZ84_16235 [Anaerolineae bacterium]|nr:hypothetical protein [Anaerolineae bacterium]HQI86163.1 hypothetical protein [Anaerolineae bacterium]